MLIGFSGPLKSGKTTVSTAVANALHLKRASFGDFVRQIAARRGLDPTKRRVLQFLGDELISKGWTKFCLDVLKSANWKKGESIVVDGIRHAQALLELARISKPLPAILIHVEIDEAVRNERIDHHTKRHIGSFESHSTEDDVSSVLPSMASIIVRGYEPLSDVVDEVVAFVLRLSEPKE